MTVGVVTIGETMGLFIASTPGGRPTDFRRGIGGAESNVAIGLARLGTPSTWVGRLGADGTGELVLRELRAEGVASGAILDHEAPTGLMVKTQPIAGRTAVEYHRAGSAGSRLSPGDIDAELIRSAQLLHVTGITPALSESAAAAIDRALDVAADAGIPISFDVNHRPSLWAGRDFAAAYRSIASRADIVFAGEDEAALLVTGTDPEDYARRLADLGPSQVLIKLGADGCFAFAHEEALRVAAVPVSVIDTVGAGDAFAAGYLAEFLAGGDLRSRLHTAVRAGAFACLGVGDWESLPHRRDLALLTPGDPVAR